MFILRLDVLFILIKSDPNIKGRECFCIVTFIQPMKAIQLFFKWLNFHYLSFRKLCSEFFGIKPNTTKCEMPGIGALKVVQAAVCRMKCIDLRNPSYSYQNPRYNSHTIRKKRQNNIISDIQGVLTLWRIKNLT